MPVICQCQCQKPIVVPLEKIFQWGIVGIAGVFFCVVGPVSYLEIQN